MNDQELRTEDRAYVICVYDRNFIQRLESVPPSTEKAYYKGIALETPPGTDIFEVAKRLAESTSEDVVKELDLKRVEIFTADIQGAMKFSFSEVHSVKGDLESNLGARFHVEDTGERSYPF